MLHLAVLVRAAAQHLTSIRFSRNKELASPESLNVSVSLIPVLIHDHMYFLDCINYVFVGLMNALH